MQAQGAKPIQSRTRWAFFGLCLLVLLARRPSTVLHAQLWAEDAMIFYRDQLMLGFRAILLPYAGYSHLLPRLIAALGGLFKAVWVPLFYNCFALVIEAACCSQFLGDRYRIFLPNDAVRAVLCIAMAAVFPCSELIGNIANLQWFAMVAAIPLILTSGTNDRHSSATTILSFLLGILLALSAPALLIVLPVLLWRSRQGRVSMMSAGFLSGLLVQLILFVRDSSLQGGSFPQTAGAVLKTTLVALSNQVILPSVLGQRHAYSLVTRGGWYAGPLVLAAFLIFIVVIGRSMSLDDRLKLASAVWFMAASVGLSMAARPSVRESLPDFSHAIRFGGERYFFCGCCFFAYCLALAWARWIGDRRRSRAALFAGFFVLSGILNFHIGPLKDLRWAIYASEIDQWSSCAQAGRECSAVSIPINPEPGQMNLPALRTK